MDLVASVQNEIRRALNEAIFRAKREKELDLDTVPDYVVEVPREKAHGDFATNVAMLMAKKLRRPPREIAEIVIKYLDTGGKARIKEAKVAGPGFINFIMEPGWAYGILPRALSEDRNFGCMESENPENIQVEFVSANPTGLLHMGNARGAALGDTICRLLEATGHKVTREFFINDAGNQIINFGKSLEARYLQELGKEASVPEKGYHGEDIIDTVKNFIREHGDKYLNVDCALRREILVKYALEEKLAKMKCTLEQFGVKYDCWYSEQTLHETGAIQKAVEELDKKGFVYEKEGALWFKASAWGGEKDEVLVRANGIPTYFAADIAYHKDKFERGFDKVIDLWGADHHGHVSRMKGAMEALGYEPERLRIVIMQLVHLFQGGEALRMSKRTGRYVTLEELIEEVGVDAARYFFVMRSADSHLDFDLDLAKSESAENPVYYVQYAHARICSILRQAARQGFAVSASQKVQYTLLKEPEELELIRKIADFPGVVAGAAENLEPHRLTVYAHDLAGLFHSFYNCCRVLTDSQGLTEARLVLVEAVRITLRNLLKLLGVSAPEKM